MSKIIFITLLVFISAFNFGSTAPVGNNAAAAASNTITTTLVPFPNLQQNSSTMSSPLIADDGSNPTASDAGNNVPSEETIPNDDGNQPSDSTINPTEDQSDITDSGEEQTPAPIHNNAASTSLSIFAFIFPIITFIIFKV